jgi:hypothetical protein
MTAAPSRRAAAQRTRPKANSCGRCWRRSSRT